MMKRKHLLPLILWFSFVTIACNLTSSDSPPTIVPRTPIGATPQATMGYSTQVPGQQLNPVATTIAQQQQIDIELFNMLNQIEQDRLIVHIDALVNLYTRHVNSDMNSLDRGIGAAFNYIQNHFLTLQQQNPEGHFIVFPEGHPFDPGRDDIQSPQRNVVAILQGTEAGAGTIIVGAHYDSRPDVLMDSTSYAPAADDNGSGVAAVMELARVLADKPQRSSIIFVLFAAEEQGRYGSLAFVRDYLQAQGFPQSNTYMINLDTIGSINDSNGNLNDYQIRVFSQPPNDSTSRQLARTINFIGFNFGLDLDIVLEDDIDRPGRWGDQQSFSDNGYPAVRFIEMLEDNYNRESRDTIDGVEPYYLTKSTRTVLGTILSLAGGPRPPVNMSFRTDESTGMPFLIWEEVPGAASYIVALRRSNDLNVSTQFTVAGESRSGAWHRWGEYEAVSVAAVDANGMIGPLSPEYRVPSGI